MESAPQRRNNSSKKYTARNPSPADDDEVSGRVFMWYLSCGNTTDPPLTLILCISRRRARGPRDDVPSLHGFEPNSEWPEKCLTTYIRRYVVFALFAYFRRHFEEDVLRKTLERLFVAL